MFKPLSKLTSIYNKIEPHINGLNVQTYLVRQKLERQLFLSGQTASWQVRQMESIETLSEVEFRVYSQFGEDGIIEWLVDNIPIENEIFVEFGVENFQEANTRFLLQNRNWRGLVMDGNPHYMDQVRQEDIYWKHDITAAPAFITKENINQLLNDHGIKGDIGLLSIDIDGNDFWVLEAISDISPRILVCEYNPILGDQHAITVPYQPDFDRLKAHYSGLYFGASIKAIQFIAGRKGYEFLGTCSNGINSFFVRRDLYESVAKKINNRKAFPSRHRDSRDESGNLSYTRGIERFNLIKSMPVVIVDQDKRQAPLDTLEPVYSTSWLNQIC